MTDPAPAPKRASVIPKERLAAVRELYLRGRTTQRIQDELSRQFHVTERTIRAYLAIVRRQIAAEATPTNLEAARARSEELLLEAYELARTRQGYTMAGTAYDNPDVKTMVAAAHRLAELHGALAPKRFEVTGKDGSPLTQGVVFVPPMKPE